MRNVVLVGFMGTGKTTIGTAVARRLRLRYVSTDDLIEKREKCTINEIFTRRGEEAFRDIESAVVRELAGTSGLVIDTGGGVVLRDGNIAHLKETGTVFCLTADEDVIFERTKKYKHRPLLNVDDPKAKIRALIARRAPLYARADYTIDTGRRTVAQAVGDIAAVMELAGGTAPASPAA